MAHEIIWTQQATDDFEAIVDYLRETWSEEIADTFIETVRKKARLLEEMPELGTVSGKYANVRRLLLSKYNVLYYQVESDLLFLLNIFDTRSNPVENPYE